MQRHPIEVTKEVFLHFGNGDIPSILALLHDEVVIQFYGPSVIPYADTYTGKTEAERFFTTVLSSVDILQFEPQQFMSDGDMVTVTGHLHLVARSTGIDFESDFVHVIRVVDGSWINFRDFMNTAVAADAFSAV